MGSVTLQWLCVAIAVVSVGFAIRAIAGRTHRGHLLRLLGFRSSPKEPQGAVRHAQLAESTAQEGVAASRARPVEALPDTTASSMRATLAQVSDLKLLLEKAISDGRDIEFTYEKPDSLPMLRRVTPRALVKIEHWRDEGYTLCVKGYCHLRQAERNFALGRMSECRIVGARDT
jgi:predicted DNA-binding transcriptional regulator YafY